MMSQFLWKANQCLFGGTVGSVEKFGEDKHVKMRLANDASYKKGDETVEKTNWLTLKAFNMADMVVNRKKIAKGDSVVVTCEVSVSKYTPEGSNKEVEQVEFHVVDIIKSVKMEKAGGAGGDQPE
jgi:single-stranded DNA-binding protein